MAGRICGGRPPTTTGHGARPSSRCRRGLNRWCPWPAPTCARRLASLRCNAKAICCRSSRTREASACNSPSPRWCFATPCSRPRPPSAHGCAARGARIPTAGKASPPGSLPTCRPTPCASAWITTPGTTCCTCCWPTKKAASNSSRKTASAGCGSATPWPTTGCRPAFTKCRATPCASAPSTTHGRHCTTRPCSCGSSTRAMACSTVGPPTSVHWRPRW